PISASPDLAPQAGKTRHRILAYREDAVTGPQSGLARGTALVETGDDDRVLDLGGKEPEPGASGAIGPTIGQHVVEDRRQQINRHHHVDVPAQLTAVGVLNMKLTDPNETAVRADQASAAPEGVRGCGKDRAIEHILPIARELLP